MVGRLFLTVLLSIFALTAPAAHAAPARAVYFTAGVSIRKFDPATQMHTEVFPAAIAAGRHFETLEVDGKNGHLYWIDSSSRMHRGNLDGTGMTQLHDTSSDPFDLKDLVVNPDTGQIFFGIDRTGIYELEISTGKVTTIFLAPGLFDLISPHLYFDSATSTLHWTEVANAVHWKKTAGGKVEALGQLPIAANWGATRAHHSDFDFDDLGNPTPYSVGRNGSSYFLVTGGLDGSPAQVHPTANIVPNPSPDIVVDADSGFIYFGGGTFDSDDTLNGLFRMKLDGTELTRLVDLPDNRISVAADTADLADSTPPEIIIFSPIGGNTNNQSASIIGSITDASTITSATWSHNGVDQGSVSIFDGDFTVQAISLVPGENVLEITAADLAGNSDSAQVTLIWQPLRAVTITNLEEIREGRRKRFDILLDSPGDVAGMTFTLNYDPVFFEAPTLDIGEAISGASPVTNILTPGEVNFTFADPSEAVPSGEQVLARVKLRARSVPDVTTSTLSIDVQDMANTGGNPIVIGTFAGTSNIDIIPRTFVGDSNSNDRLDTGDSTRMQAMLAGNAETRPWDQTLNDLNGSSTLDSGDVIRVLRAVVELDPQPSAPPAGGRAPRGTGSPPPDAPHARLLTSQSHAATGEQIAVSVQVENTTDAFSGGSFTLDYPIDALRLDNAGSHAPGAIVAGDAFLLWNVTPSRNDYINQNGTLHFGASSSSSWPSSAGGGPIAELTFTVQPGASAQAVWPITIRDAEISTDAGFEIVPLGGDTRYFIGEPRDYATWAALHFTPTEIDQGLSAENGDPDGDGAPNAVEFYSGSDPRDGASQPGVRTRLLAGATSGHCFEMVYERDLTSIAVTAAPQISTDLATWLDIDDADLTSWSSIDAETATETIVSQIQLPPSATRRFVRLEVSL